MDTENFGRAAEISTYHAGSDKLSYITGTQICPNRASMKTSTSNPNIRS